MWPTAAAASAQIFIGSADMWTRSSSSSTNNNTRWIAAKHQLARKGSDEAEWKEPGTDVRISTKEVRGGHWPKADHNNADNHLKGRETDLKEVL